MFVAGIYSTLLMCKATELVEEFMNIHIATNIGITIILFFVVYGTYFLVTFLSCNRMVTEHKVLEADD